MNEQQYEDLKQLIKTTASQTEKALRSEIHESANSLEGRLSARIDRLEAKMDNGFASMAEAIDTLSAQADADKAKCDQRLDNHEHRIERLEQAAA